MRKEVKILFVCISLILIIGMPFASAGWLSDFWTKISGDAPITGYAGSTPSDPIGEEGNCTGTATACSEFSEIACSSQGGCSWDEGGSYFPNFILRITGKIVSGGSCTGTATACTIFTGSSSCGAQEGCSWDEDITIEPISVCGDGIIEGFEECDDDNQNNEDGCSSSCDLETGSCIGGSSCESNHNNYASCTAGDCVWTYLDCTDIDGDDYSPEGYGCGAVDCNDNVGSIYLGSTEICGNGIDEDCNGADLDCATNCIDIDGDGYGIEGLEDCIYPQLDCNDNERTANPGETEVCSNNIDENCNGLTDEFCTDYSIQSANYLYSENAYENSDMPVVCSVNLEGDYNVETPNLADLIPENCIQIVLEGSSSDCNVVSTNIAVDGVYKTFSCNVGDVGNSKEILCAINSSVCSPGINASSETSFIDVVSPVSCIANSEAGPLILNADSVSIEGAEYSSGGIIDFNFDVTNSLEANVLNLVHEVSIYNLNNKEEIFSISQPSPVSTTETFNFSLNLPEAGAQDKFRMYLKVYNPSNEIGACSLQRFDLNIIPIATLFLDADIDFRNLTNKRITTSLGEVKTFTLDGANEHHLELAEVLDPEVIVTLSSTPFNVTLEEGISQEVDLDGDGINDINITLVSIDGGNVDIDLGTLQEFEICSLGETRSCSNGLQTGTEFCANGAWGACQYNEVSGTGSQYNSGSSEGNNEDEGTNQNAPPTEESKPLYLYILIGIIVLLVLGVIIVLVKKKKNPKQGIVGPAPTLPMPPRRPIPPKPSLARPITGKPIPPKLMPKQPIRPISPRPKPTNIPPQRTRPPQPIPRRPMPQKPARMPIKQPRQGIPPKK
jgi:cysteine-rich repeat protein